MSKFWSDVVRELVPYTPGEQPKLSNLIKLNTNENPYGPSPQVLAAIASKTGESLRLYPDPEATRLREAIGQFFGLSREQIFVGNGSDEVLAHTFQALLKHSLPILFPDVTYSFYPVYCGLYGVDYTLVPLADDYTIQIDDYCKANGGIIFPNPNAPTGRLVSLAAIKRLLEQNTESVVVIDEAYIDFGGESAAAFVNDFPNLLVIQTMSKSRSLAGLRVGYALGHADLIAALYRIKDSFNSYPLGQLAIEGAIAAMEDREYFDRTRQAIMQSRDTLVQALSDLGFQVLPSAANFVFATHPAHDAIHLASALRQRNIIVRHFNQPRTRQFLRITIGTDEQCRALVAALAAILKSGVN